MSHGVTLAPTVLASFMASMVEFVEALTVVLAVGLVRGWRSALLGTGAALGVLIVLVALLGPSLTRIPLPVVQAVVGTLLLMFGLRWLRKAVLRAAGVLALHDEAKAFQAEMASLRGARPSTGSRIDSIAFGASFKIVMLEGIEVVFIVIAIGAGGPLIVPASIGAGAALLVVAGLGVAVHRPLSRVPENTLKFGVGVLLSAFGSFWVGEGIGLAWPGGDVAIGGLVVAYLFVALALRAGAARLHRARPRPRPLPVGGDLAPAPAASRRGFARTIAGELWGLFVDDLGLAAGIVVLVVAAWAATHAAPAVATWIGPAFTAALNVLLMLSVARRAWR